MINNKFYYSLKFILFFNWVEYKPASYGHYVYPLWADAVGWFIGLLPVSVIIITAIHQIIQAPSNLTFKEVSFYYYYHLKNEYYRIFSFSQKFITLMKPTQEWGPAGGKNFTNNYETVTNTIVLVNGVPLPTDSPTTCVDGNFDGLQL